MSIEIANESGASVDEAALADSILELHRNSQLRDLLTANASRYIQENNWNVKKQRYIGLVDRLTSNNRTTAH